MTATIFIDTVFASGCACLGDTLTYECTIISIFGGGTVWTGSAFDCQAHEIFLPHFQFLGDGIYRTCNNGAIVARSLSVEGNNYTSQLNVTITPDTVGKTIECHNDNGIHVYTHFSSAIPSIGISPTII